MNVLTIFDQRITAIFEEGAPGSEQPFSFKRLAKRAVREMEDETFVIDGVDTAPALYTILISQADDALMRPLYAKICDEISQLIEAQAKKRGYTFVGRPLVRFMVDPALRPGRFSIFAENIDPRTLARLRDEENAFLGLTPMRDMHPSQSFVPKSVPVHEEEPMPVAQQSSFIESDPLDAVVPDEPAAEPAAAPDDVAPAIPDLPVDELDAVPVVAPVADAEPEHDPFAFVPEDYASELAEESAAVSSGSHFAEPTPEPEPVFAPEPQAAPAEPVCSLVDLGSGRTYRVTSDHAPIGREHGVGYIVLSDPNASRRHAELLYDGAHWHVRDLNSTNGTLVNDVDVTEALLNDGDVLTIGLTNLEFRAG